MQVFKVRCFDAEVWDGNDPSDVEANNEQEAAERVCGVVLRDNGMPGQYCVEVYLPSAPATKKCFYVQSAPISN